MRLVISLVVFVADVAGPPPGQRLLVTLLDLNVASLQLQCSRQRTAGPHSREVLGCVDSEDIAQDLRQNWHQTADMQIHRVDAHQDEAKPVLAVRAARQVGKAKETALDVVLVLCNGGRGDQLAHETPGGSPVGLNQCCLLVRPVGVPEGAVHNVQRISQLIRIRLSGFRICH